LIWHNSRNLALQLLLTAFYIITGKNLSKRLLSNVWQKFAQVYSAGEAGRTLGKHQEMKEDGLMGRFNKKGMLLLLAGLIITLMAATSVYAANAKPILNTVKAYSGVKIVYNGNELTGDKSPYIINDTTYIPLRMLMENLGKTIYWDAMNYRVVVLDTGNEAS
jgi:hypothetical protein